MIPVASRYVLRRNLFGYDINKKGTPQGSVKVSESLVIAVGIIFLVFAILFQHFNFASDSNVKRVSIYSPGWTFSVVTDGAELRNRVLHEFCKLNNDKYASVTHLYNKEGLCLNWLI